MRNGGRGRRGGCSVPKTATDRITQVEPQGPVMVDSKLTLPIGHRITLPGHFDVAVTLEDVRLVGDGYECRGRLPDGTLDEAVISADEARALAGVQRGAATNATVVNAERMRLLVESASIRLAYAYDQQFAVSLSGIRTLPHQVEAVYERMLPQPRLRSFRSTT